MATGARPPRHRRLNDAGEDARLHTTRKSWRTQSDRGIYILGALLGVCAGFLDVKVGDLLLTALFVLRPPCCWARFVLSGPGDGRCWWLSSSRWCKCIAYLLLTEKPYRAQIYESFLGFLTGIAGAYGGATARRGLGELWK